MRGLTPRQREVLDLVAGGYTNQEIARALRVSHHTVKNHLTRIGDFRGGGINRVQLAVWWVTEGQRQPSEDRRGYGKERAV